MKPMPPLKALIPFHAVARHLNFSHAAHELSVSHSAISQSIKHLEAFLGKRLFHRNTKNIQLTKTGEQYFQSIDEALSLIQSASKIILSEHNKKTITVNMLSSFAMRWLIPRMHGFQNQYPDYDLRLSSEWRQVDFDHEDIDLAIYYGEGNWPSLTSELIFSEEIAILASPALLQNNQQISMDKLTEKYKCLYVKPVQREDNFTTYFNAIDRPEPAESAKIYFQSTLQCLQAAIHGTGLIAANIHLLQDEIHAGTLVKVVKETVVTGNAFYLVYPTASVQQQKIKDYKAWLLSVTESD